MYSASARGQSRPAARSSAEPATCISRRRSDANEPRSPCVVTRLRLRGFAAYARFSPPRPPGKGCEADTRNLAPACLHRQASFATAKGRNCDTPPLFRVGIADAFCHAKCEDAALDRAAPVSPRREIAHYMKPGTPYPALS